MFPSFFQKLIACYESKTAFDLSLWDSAQMIKDAWKEVTGTTVANCFRHAGFKTPDPCLVLAEKECPTHPDFGNIFDKIAEFLSLPENVRT